MPQVFTPAQLAAHVTALQIMFSPVLLADPAAGTLLDPVTLAPCPGALPPLPALNDQGRAWLPLCAPDDTGRLLLAFYQGITVSGRPLVLIAGYGMLFADPSDDRETNALHRALHQYGEERYRDYLTGVHNRRYLTELFCHQAAAAAAEGPFTAALVRVAEYDALCRAEDPAAVDRCLTAAAGVLRTALDPAWPHAVLARLEGGQYLIAAAVEPAVLQAALSAAHTQSRRRFSVSLSRRGQFSLYWALAAWAETGSWQALLDLAAHRLNDSQ